MAFLDKVRDLWREETGRVLRGWVASEPPTRPLTQGTGDGKYYLEVRCTTLSLRYSRERFAERSPVFQSIVLWPCREKGQIAVSRTLKPVLTDDDDPDFSVFEISDVALTGDLPLNSGNVEVKVALLAAPGSSLLDQAADFLNSVASLTQIPQLTAAAPIADKIVVGVDSMLGNEETKGVLAFQTSVAADSPRPGFYLVTDLPAKDSNIASFKVHDGQLERYNGNKWIAATGFSYMVFEIRIEANKPTRWAELPEIVALSESALVQLTNAKSVSDIHNAWPQMQLAVIRALKSQDLIDADRRPAAEALTAQWKAEVDRLNQYGSPVEVHPTTHPGLDEDATPATPTGEGALAAAGIAISEDLDSLVTSMDATGTPAEHPDASDPS